MKEKNYVLFCKRIRGGKKVTIDLIGTRDKITNYLKREFYSLRTHKQITDEEISALFKDTKVELLEFGRKVFIAEVGEDGEVDKETGYCYTY